MYPSVTVVQHHVDHLDARVRRVSGAMLKPGPAGEVRRRTEPSCVRLPRRRRRIDLEVPEPCVLAAHREHQRRAESGRPPSIFAHSPGYDRTTIGWLGRPRQVARVLAQRTSPPAARSCPQDAPPKAARAPSARLHGFCEPSPVPGRRARRPRRRHEEVNRPQARRATIRRRTTASRSGEVSPSRRDLSGSGPVEVVDGERRGLFAGDGYCCGPPDQEVSRGRGSRRRSRSSAPSASG